MKTLYTFFCSLLITLSISPAAPLFCQPAFELNSTITLPNVFEPSSNLSVPGVEVFRLHLATISIPKTDVTSDIPQLLEPQLDAVLYCQATPVALRWMATEGTATYFVEVATDAAMTQIIVQKVVTFDTVSMVTVPGKEQDYFWRVRTGLASSDIRKFSTRLPGLITLTTLYAGNTVISDTVYFAWNSDPAASGYQMQFQSKGLEARDTILEGNSVRLILPHGHMYTWMVRSMCSVANGAWSVTDSVFVRPEINGVDEFAYSESLLISPNPATDIVTVREVQSGHVPSELLMYDVVGQMIAGIQRCNEGGYILDLRSLENGLYVLVVRSGEHVSTGRIVVRR